MSIRFRINIKEVSENFGEFFGWKGIYTEVAEETVRHIDMIRFDSFYKQDKADKANQQLQFLRTNLDRVTDSDYNCPELEYFIDWGFDFMRPIRNNVPKEPTSTDRIAVRKKLTSI